MTTRQPTASNPTGTKLQRRRAMRHRGPTDRDLVYKTRLWDRMKYDEYRDQSATMRDVEAGGIDRNERFPDFSREVFARMYRSNVDRLDDAADGAQWAEKLHDVAEGLPEFDALRRRVRGDQMYSGMAASSICEKVAEQLEPQESNADLEQMKTRLEELERMHDAYQEAQPDQPNPFEKRLQQSREELTQAEADAAAMAAGLDETSIRQAVRAGVQQAQEEIAAAQQAFDCFSYGDTPGTPQARNDWKAKREIADKVGRHRQLQELAVLAGRMRRIAAQKRREKTDHAVEEIADIETGADLPRLLPTELLQLCDDDLEALAFSRYLDRACLQYKLQGTEPLGKGAVIFLTDESGSMQGDRDMWAKAVALAGLDLAVRDKRPWGYVHFDATVSRRDLITKQDYSNPSHVASVVMDSMMHFTGGGTNFEKALDAALDMRISINDLDTADLILVTDGCAPVSDVFKERWAKRLEEFPCKLLVVLVGAAQSHNTGLEGIADQVFKMSEILESETGDFYDSVFTL